jgi:hypothetical protein
MQATLGKWSLAEHKRIEEAVSLYGTNWKLVSEFVQTRANFQCRAHWNETLNKVNTKSKFTEDEDQSLLELVQEHGEENWDHISLLMKRSSLKCKKRYKLLKATQKRKKRS